MVNPSGFAAWCGRRRVRAAGQQEKGTATMSESARNEERYLSTAEREIVARTHLPALKELAADDLVQTKKLVRELRDRARDIAHRQRRQIRGKAAPRGAQPASDDAGSRRKLSILAAAMKRLSAESRRRRERAAKAELVANAHTALALKRGAAHRHHPAPGRTSRRGMRAKPSTRAEQITDPREVGRVSQFVKDAQARRDG
jgi:hypothetical protein